MATVHTPIRTASTLADRAALSELIARAAVRSDLLATSGKPAVCFIVVSHIAGSGIETAAQEIAKAMSFECMDLRPVSMEKADLIEGQDVHDHARRIIENMPDAFIVCSEMGAASSDVARELISFLLAQDVDRDDIHRPRVVMLSTHGDAATMIDMVREITRVSPVGFLVLK